MPAVHEHHLPNGLTLLCCHQPHLHSVHFGLYLKGGSLYEEAQTQGISHLLEHLCFRGIGELDHEQLNLFQCRLGTDLEGATYPDAIVFTMYGLSRFFSDLLRLFRRFFIHREWTQEEIDIEKQVVLRQIEESDPGFDDEVELRYRATAAGAFPVMGTVDSVLALSRETIMTWKKLIFQPNNACLCISGNFTKGMEAAAIAVFSDLSGYTDRPPFSQTLPEHFCMRGPFSDLIKADDSTHASVRLAFDINSEHVYPVVDEIVSAITAGNNDSLLFQRMREELAMVAEIESYIETMGEYRRLIISYDVRQHQLPDSLRETFSLLRRLCMYIRPVRMVLSRMQFTDNYEMMQDSAASMNEMMGWSWIAGDIAQCDLDAQARMYDDLTVEDLQTAAQSIFRNENLTVSIQYDPDACPVALDAVLDEVRAMLD